MSSLIYQVHDRPPFWKNIFFALQQVMAIITATMLVPLLADYTGVYLSQAAALIGAGVGTIIYLLFTRFKSPVFLGSSFTFILPISSAITFGYFGIFLGSLIAGLVYVGLALLIKFVGSDWINKIMPPIIIGPTSRIQMESSPAQPIPMPQKARVRVSPSSTSSPTNGSARSTKLTTATASSTRTPLRGASPRTAATT